MPSWCIGEASAKMFNAHCAVSPLRKDTTENLSLIRLSKSFYRKNRESSRNDEFVFEELFFAVCRENHEKITRSFRDDSRFD